MAKINKMLCIANNYNKPYMVAKQKPHKKDITQENLFKSILLDKMGLQS